MRLTKLVSAQHRQELEKLLAGQPEHHLLLLARLPMLGLDERIVFWSLEGLNGPQALLVLDGDEWALANPGGADLYPLSQVVDLRGRGRVRGEAGAVNALARHVRTGLASDRSCLLVRLHAQALPAEDPAGVRGRAVTLPSESLTGLEDLWGDGSLPLDLVACRGGRAVIVYEGESPVSAAWTEAEYHGMAMIGGVWTVPARRREGWGTSCLWTLCRNLAVENLQAQLVYEEPAFGRLAARLGFLPFGRWRRLVLDGGPKTGHRQEAG